MKYSTIFKFIGPVLTAVTMLPCIALAIVASIFSRLKTAWVAGWQS